MHPNVSFCHIQTGMKMIISNLDRKKIYINIFNSLWVYTLTQSLWHWYHIQSAGSGDSGMKHGSPLSLMLPGVMNISTEWRAKGRVCVLLFPLCVEHTIHVPVLLPEQQMQMMPWHTIQLDCFQIKVWTVSPKGQIWETNWICPQPMDICLIGLFMTQFIKK